MSSPLFANDLAVLPYTPAADHTAKRGFLVALATTIATVSSSATVAAHGIILDGQNPTGNTNAQDSIGILGGNLGIVKVKAGAAAITKFSLLQQSALGTAEDDDGAGARVVFGRALEAAAAGELFDAIVFNPVVYAS